MPGNGTIINNGFGSPQGMTGEQVYDSYWQNGDVFGDWFRNQDTFGHNEAIAAYNRELAGAKEMFDLEANFNASEAEKNRQFEKYLSDTAFQRKVADLKAAGFSPLAALDGATGAPMASGSAAAAHAKAPGANPARKGVNPIGGLIGSFVMAAAMLAGKGIDAASKAAASSGKAAADIARDNNKFAAMVDMEEIKHANRLELSAKDFLKHDALHQHWEHYKENREKNVWDHKFSISK